MLQAWTKVFRMRRVTDTLCVTDMGHGDITHTSERRLPRKMPYVTVGACCKIQSGSEASVQ